jgi:hypothetical protein
LYVALARRRHGDRVLGGATDIVIEGFPRSANTFAVTAFTLAQSRPVTVAHHLHAPAHVIRAVHVGVPVILLVRRPDDAIASVVARKPALRPADVARAYVRFYEGVHDSMGGCVVADFTQVTSGFGDVIERVNARFGTAFAPFIHTDENVRRCFAQIESESRRRASGRLLESVVARPSTVRAAEGGAEASLPTDLRDRLVRVYDLIRSQAV